MIRLMTFPVTGEPAITLSAAGMLTRDMVAKVPPPEYRPEVRVRNRTVVIAHSSTELLSRALGTTSPAMSKYIG